MSAHVVKCKASVNVALINVNQGFFPRYVLQPTAKYRGAERTVVEDVYKLRQWVTIGHHIPGRVRFKFSKGVVSYAARFKSKDIERAASQFPALKDYRLNMTTGSLLIEYDDGLLKPNTIEQLFSSEPNEVENACKQIAQVAKSGSR